MFIGPFRPKVQPTVTAVSTIRAGSSVASHGTLPVTDGSVTGQGGDWLRYASVDFGKGVNGLDMQLGSDDNNQGLRIQVRLDSATGPLLGTVRPPAGKKGKSARIELAHIKKVTGVHDVYLVFVGKKGQLDVQTFNFVAPPSK